MNAQTTHNLDLLLVNPPSREYVYRELGSEFTAIEPPVWAGMIASFIKNKEFTVEILDAEAALMTFEETALAIIEKNPLLTVFVVYGHQPSASTQCMPAAGAVSGLVKNQTPDLKIMFMGPHVSALPELTLIEESIDFACQGEGPYTIENMLITLKSGKNDYSKIGGLWYYENNKIFNNSRYDLIKNIDQEFSGVVWDLLDMKKYRAHNWHCWDDLDKRSPYAAIYTSFGCPYKCEFCCINASFGKNTIRYISPETVIRQIDILVNEYGVKNIKISDEMFVLDEKHVSGLCDLIIQRGYDLNIWAYARVDTVKEKMLNQLKAAGFNWLALGIESASGFVRKDVSKGKFGYKDIIDSVKMIKNAGINIMANYIFGLPEDDIGSMQRTLDLAMELSTESVNFYCAMAYPGSALYTMAKNKGLTLPNSPKGSGWIGYSQHSYETLPLPTEHLSAGEVLRFRDEAFLTYFRNEKYLSMMKNKFGDKVITHIKGMTSKRLQRKHINFI